MQRIKRGVKAHQLGRVWPEDGPRSVTGAGDMAGMGSSAGVPHLTVFGGEPMPELSAIAAPISLDLGASDKPSRLLIHRVTQERWRQIPEAERPAGARCLDAVTGHVMWFERVVD